jgi:hypothetical protein
VENKDLVDDGRRRAHAGLSMQSTTRAGTAMCSEPRRLVLIERCRRVCRQRGRQHRGHSPVGQSGAWVGGLGASRDQGPPSWPRFGAADEPLGSGSCSGRARSQSQRSLSPSRLC